MSFKCDKCDRYQGEGVKPILVVSRLRRVIYELVAARTGEVVRSSRGHEIVEEKALCRGCVAVTPPPEVIPGPPKHVLTMLTMVAKA